MTIALHTHECGLRAWFPCLVGITNLRVHFSCVKKAFEPKTAIRTATPSSIRAVNRAILLELIRLHQPVSRADLARLTGIFRSSVSEIVDELIEEHLLLEHESFVPGRPGRVPKDLSLNDESYPVFGINIRPQYFQLAFAGLNGRIRKSLTFETPAGAKELIVALKKAVASMRRELEWPKDYAARCMGISIPGHVDPSTGSIVWVPTHAELNGLPIGEIMTAQTGIPTLVDNDCNLGALSELWLTTAQTREKSGDFVFLNVSDFGTGAGVIVDGEIYRSGDGHFAAEMGHMVVDRNGPLCSCGRRGCWELYVSNNATWRRVHPKRPYTEQGLLQLFTRARDSDQRARASLMETADYLSLGISNIAFAFNPAEVVLAGRLTAAWDLIEARVKKSFASSRLNLNIRPAHLSADDSLLHGAVCLALRDVFSGPKFGQE